jgi:hypothetical protein
MPNHALILVEGETEIEFIGQIAQKNFPHHPRSIKNLYGNFSINRKILDKIVQFTQKNPHKPFFVLVCIDQERRGVPPINLDAINAELKRKAIVTKVIPIIAQLMTESLFFADIDGIYAFLRAPHVQRKPAKFKNFRRLTHVDLSRLFHQFDNCYRKGHRVKNFVKNLDIDKIVESCEELRKLVCHCSE